MTQAQNRALRSVLLSHLRHLDRFIMYIETAPGVDLKDSIYEGIRMETSYQRASIRAAIQQLEDTHEEGSSITPPSGRLSLSESTGSSSN